jgi:hypothetical protein
MLYEHGSLDPNAAYVRSLHPLREFRVDNN